MPSSPQLVILQPGEKLPSLDKVPGDFADWVAGGMNVPLSDVRVVYPHRDQSLPTLSSVKAVVITGSSAMVTDNLSWIRQGSRWLRDAVEKGIPTLGICFGHQWLAQALGGAVADNPKGTEVGTVEVRLDATGDALLGELPSRLPLQASHRQSVVKLPPGSVHLGSSELEPNHAFRFGKNIWGVQFHPEFSAEIIRGYIDYHAESVRACGGDPEGLCESVVDEGYGGVVLKRFAEFVGL